MDIEAMRGGYTTGSCATAGMKAALMALLSEEYPSRVTVINPQDTPIDVPIKSVEVISDTEARGTVVKDGGDDPDVTHGTDVVTTVQLTTDGELQFRAGFGVGTVTKPGLAMPPGEPAINPGPRTMMTTVFKEFCTAGQGVIVTVSVPNGEVLAKKTLNSTLGIEGGIFLLSAPPVL